MPEQIPLDLYTLSHVRRGAWERWPEDRGRMPEVTIRSPLLCGVPEEPKEGR